jgi:WD40 repeat protein
LGLKLWTSATHALRGAYPAHGGHVASVAWSPDNSHLLTGGGYLDPTVQLWDVKQSATASPLHVYKDKAVRPGGLEPADVEAVAFHPNQKWLISAGETGRIKIWDISTEKELLTAVGIPGGDGYVAYAPNGCYTGSANVANYVKYE